jgi:hypothetical protein
MGTTVTMCGEAALSWFKFWELSFDHVGLERCPRCVAIVTAQLKGQTALPELPARR